ncbi:hypothetical protein ACWEF6_11320 [Amycolatopsis sp. NPDC004772]
MLIVLVLLLAASIALHLVVNNMCLQHSISGYYYTSSQATFVGMLCAIGACLIIYQGAEVENALLDFSGFMAFIVAFVPTGVDNTCKVGSVADIETTPEVVTTLPPVLAAAVGAGIWAFVKRPQGKAAGLARVVKGVTLFVVAAMAFWAGVFPGEFGARGHLFAAGSMFAGMVLVVGWNYWDTSRERYGVVFWGMVGALVAWLAALKFVPFPHLTLGVEAALIAGFAWFWIWQTVELKGRADRPVADSKTHAAAEAAGR